MEPPTDINDVDFQLALKLKAKYPEHFQNLVRMHLSFALDLNLEERDEQTEKIKANPAKWNFGKKLKTGKDKDSVDGDSLSQAKISRICRLISFLCRTENLTQEGIFRKTGSLNRQVQLKTCLNEGISVDFDDNNFSVHDCASVLKNYLSELPEPIVTDAYYPLYCQISEWGKCSEFESRLLRSLQLLSLLLPSNNSLLLKHIINLLHMTSKYDKQNKMSSMNLATLFTPHILCPRKLSAEVFHSQAKMLYQVVEFMIEWGPDIFRIPTGLAADLRLYWHEKEKKRLSPKNCLNESTADSCVVNTVFSFVDREKTAQENVINPTETALAQLYAHIQSLPESSKKRKLVKQFNKENGYGTPKRVLLNNNTDKSHSLTKNISDSLKKHIFSKNSNKIEKLKCPVKEKSESIPSEVMMTPRSRRPVLAVSGSNKGDSEGALNFIVDPQKNVDEPPRKIERPPDNFEFLSESSKNSESLTDPFREYLYSRSIVTTSPIDDTSPRLDPCSLSVEKISESLLYCLDGGTPSHNSDDSIGISPRMTTYENTGHVHETLL